MDVEAKLDLGVVTCCLTSPSISHRPGQMLATSASQEVWC